MFGASLCRIPEILGTKRRSFILFVFAFTVALLATLAFGKPAAGATLPSGFADEKVVGVDAPTAIAFTPDGRMLIGSKPGKLQVYKGGKLQGPALDLGNEVCANSERGLLGVAVDPKFRTNRYIYVYYTFKKHGVCESNTSRAPVNRVERFVLKDDNTVDPDTARRKILVDNIPSPNGNHNAGDLHFGKDDYLYVSVGDGGCDYADSSKCQYNNDAARDSNILLGKILRVTRDGGIPSDNPYTGTNSARCGVPDANGRTSPGKNCQETYAKGLRNPFRIAFDPDANGTSFRINDVGGRYWEEIDVGKRAADYGWNICEGRHDNPFREGSVNCTAAPYTPPIHEYNHDKTGCSSITGAAFVPDGVWPSSYDKSYLFGDYVCGKIFKLTPKSGGGYTRTTLLSGLGRGGPVHMAFGPYDRNQALYYATYTNGGEIRRVSHSTSVNKPPTAAVDADPTYGPDVPLTVNFDATKSSDPNGDPLTYIWDFENDGTVDRETDVPTTSYEYTTAGTYTATLKVRDEYGATSSAKETRIFPGNTPPEPAITAPATDFRFRVGEEVTVSGTATDAEDSDPVSLKWEVLRHHNNSHTHPYESGTESDLTFKAPAPEELSATGPGNHLEVRLTATDSSGLEKTVSRKLEPRRVAITFDTAPAGLKLGVNGSVKPAPRTLTSWDGYKLNVEAREQLLGSQIMGDASWSDGGGASHQITTPGTDTTYTATFKQVAQDTTLTMKSTRSLVPYLGSVSLVGRISSPGGPVTGKKVTVLRSTDRGRNWNRDGTAFYDAASKTYKASRRLKRNTLYRMRFEGDSAYRATSSAKVSVRARAFLSRPVVSSGVRKNKYFTVRGYLRPYHDGRTQLSFYHYRNGQWRFYKTIYSRNHPYNGFTKHVRRYKLPYTGRWYVRAYHQDASHAATRSPREVFRVVK